MKLLNQQEAIDLDQDLFNDYGYSVYQLMELAGLSIAQSIAKSYPISDERFKRPIVCCGPGNNGGDGLVAARHLKIFGYSPTIIYPREPKQELYKQLLKQCRGFDIEILESVPDESLDKLGNLIVDCIFGFSFKPPNRNVDFAKLLNKIAECCCHDVESQPIVPLISVDIPSGWDVEKGPADLETNQSTVDRSLKIPILKPDCLISLTAPKLCSSHFSGRYHYLGGRFCPDILLKKYDLTLPQFANSDGIVLLDQSPKSKAIVNDQTTNIVRTIISRLRSIRF